MEKFYFFSETLFDMWESDLEMEENRIEPSKKVIDAIIDYSQIAQVYSPTLKRNIAINLN